MTLDRDYFDNPIIPDYVLCKANKERIGTLKCTEKTIDVKYNDLNEIHLVTYMNIDDEKNPYYDAVDVMKYILLPDIGFFCISDCNVQSEGTEFEYKEVTAKSYECLLGQKYLETFIINKGTTGSIGDAETGYVQFYNLENKSKSLLHLVLNEKCPDWKIGHVDTELYTMQRSFEVDRQDIYSFLMNDVATAFECVFLFDTLTNTINIYQEKNVGEDTDIHVSYNNLMKNTNISCSIEDIKTCLTVTGSDDLSIREINMGNDRIIMLDYYNSTEYMSEGLYNAYNAWVKLQAQNKPQYNTLLSQFQNYYSQINELTYNKMPDDPDSTDWSLYGLNPLKEKLAVYEQKQAVSMKAGHGESSSPFYESEYLPIYNTINAINSQIEKVNKQLDTLKSEQEKIETDMSAIANVVAMENNFTKEQLKELSTFIREDELNSDNFVVTDIMTDDERFDMLKQMLKFGEKELEKLATPQLSFSVDMVNIFAIPEFERLYGKFDVGNYIWVTLRDNYHVKAKLQTMHMNFYDVSDFSVTFGNVLKKDNKLLDISNALSVAESVSTSVSFNSSYWSQAYKDATNIGKVLADGLLAAGNYLSSGDDSELLIDSRGMFVNTTSGEYANKDSIFIGGGRILFTDDAWKTVAMAVGRANVNGESKFGVFADFCIAAYIAGSTIEGNKIIGGTITGSDFNNGNGTFHVDKDGNLTATSATIKGNISGSTITGSSINNGNGTFHVDENGKLTASDANITKGTIGGAVIQNNSIKASNNRWYINADGSSSFDKPYIGGVQNGSSFGSLGFDGTNTWGNFTGNSYYGSSANNPFSGTCKTHIESLSANYIKTNYLDAMNANISNLFANEAQLGNLIVDNSARISTIESDYVKTQQLDAVNASIGSLNAKTTNIENQLRYNGVKANWQVTTVCTGIGWTSQGVKLADGSTGSVGVIKNVTYKTLYYLGMTPQDTTEEQTVQLLE